VSSRRNTSLVVALGVAALAGTSLAAMVATSELLVESFGRPVSGRLDPPVPDLGPPKVVQVEPPEPGRVGPRGRRPGAPGGSPPPRRRSPGGPAPEADRGEVVVAVQRLPARQERVAVRRPSLDRRPTLPDLEPSERPRPERPRPERPRTERPRPERPEPTRPWKRWTGPKPHHDPQVRVPVAPKPHKPRPADPDGGPRGGSPCPDRHRRDRDHHRWDHRRHWRDRDGRGEDRDRSWDWKGHGRRDGDGHGRDRARRAEESHRTWDRDRGPQAAARR
jgi:hypothetical protein